MEAELHKITDEDIAYCEWIARELYRRRYQRQPDEDEMQDCMVGMCEAAEDYDESKGAKFASYAKIHIFKAMQLGRPGRMRPSGVPVKPDMYLMGSQCQVDCDGTIFKKDRSVEKEILQGIGVTEVLDLFPPNLRKATIRHYFEGEEYKDMTKDFGYSSNSSLATVLGVCRKEIRALLGGDDD